MRLKWKEVHAVNRDQEYLVFLSEIPLRSHAALIHVFLAKHRIGRQLRAARGMMGYSTFVQIVRKRFYTLSVWESEQALFDFAHEGPHLVAVAQLQGELRPTRFMKWTINGTAYPPDWKEALARSADQAIERLSPSSA